MKKFLLLFLCISFIPLNAQIKAITFDDLMAMKRLADPQVSPDGMGVLFSKTVINKAENNAKTDIFMLEIVSGAIRQLTSSKGNNFAPRWMPDGATIIFISSRDGSQQLYRMSVSGGEPKKLSNVAGGISAPVISPDGKFILFASSIFPDAASEEDNRKRFEELEKNKLKAKVIDRLLYRHWNHFRDGQRTHVLSIPTEGGVSTDITPGDYDSPPISLGGDPDYSFSNDVKFVAFVKNLDTMVAISTNNEIFIKGFPNGTEVKITENPGNDNNPLFSPDGKYLAYVSMARPGFEADKQALVIYSIKEKTHKRLTDRLDRSVQEIIWSPDSKTLFFTANHYGGNAIFRVGIDAQRVDTLMSDGYNRSIRVTPDGKSLIFLRERMHQPAEIFSCNINGTNLRKLTSINDALVASLQMNRAEEIYYQGAHNDLVQAWILKPPFFENGRRYPAVFLIHGGPQSHWGDQFHYRWSAQMFASRGHVVVMINPRGSTGFGQKFTDEVSNDWGGKAYEDIMLGLDHIGRVLPYVDTKRIAAAGASYGGYMVNWIAGSTDRFRCLVSHAGVFNPASMYGSTEELWFPEWEFGGTYYENPDNYMKFSPLEKAKNFKTPTLVTHGQLDYRVDISEGMQMFTALQRNGVTSRMIYFPDEGHWIAKPLNSELWHDEVLDWIERFTK